MNILLADNDSDDRLIFARILNELITGIHLETVNNGEELMAHLHKASQMPDVLFLDLNMPLKNGKECLLDIKQNERTSHVPVIIYSTSLHKDIAEQLYQMGAHFYIRKSGLEELEKTLSYILGLFAGKKPERPPRDKFILGEGVQ